VPAQNFFSQVWTAIKHTGKALINSPLARTIAGLVVSALSLYLILKTVHLGEVGISLGNANLFWVALVLVCVILNLFVKTFRWQVLIGPPGNGVPFSQIFMSLVSGQLLNLIFPARIGDVSRAYTIGGMGPGMAYVFGTIVIEKVLDFLIYLTLFVVLLVLIPLPEWINQPVVSITLIAFVFTLAIFIILFRRDILIKGLNWLEYRLPASIRQATIRQLRSGIASLDILNNRSSLIKVGVWSFLIWLTALIINDFTMRALGIQLPLSASLFILIALLAGVTLPAAPASIGLFEAICVLTLGYYGINPSLALTYGLVLHFLVLVPVLIIGLISMWILGLSKKKILAAENAPVDAQSLTQKPEGDF
jgi:glycosyltransferase 2 family protein